MTPQTVCVQGLGFVGSAMAVATARAGHRVVGLELPTEAGLQRVHALNHGTFPFATTDASLTKATRDAHDAGRLSATTDVAALASADIVVVDVHLDLTTSEDGYAAPQLAPFAAAIETIGRHTQAGALVLVESTVPPGTCERVVRPLLDQQLALRGLSAGSLQLAHSYERVMPGADYLASITHYWRVFAGETAEAAARCRAFLSTVIDTTTYPLAELSTMTASETAKVLENTFRATTIALMEEWGRFAETIGVDLFEVVSAIRQRPTHANIRQPGFGVGGYCLTKDPLMAGAAARTLFGVDTLHFPFSESAVRVNAAAPMTSVARLEQLLNGLAGRRILLLGVAYRQDVADTRYSPSEAFVREAEARGAQLFCHDPLVTFWPELDRSVLQQLPAPNVDAIVVAVPHTAYRTLDLAAWVGSHRPLLFDANAVLSSEQQRSWLSRDLPLWIVGRGAISRSATSLSAVPWSQA